MISKGADSVITELLAEGQSDKIAKTDEFVQEFAEEGLRTLFIAKK